MPNIISEKIDRRFYKERCISGKWNECKYKFYAYKNISYRKYKNLISVSLFMLPFIDEVYASQKNISVSELSIIHENKSAEYISGLKFIIERCGDVNVRIFCDHTSVKYCEKHLKETKVEIIYFHFEQFFNDKKRCHIGFFGTLMRYLPLFNFTEFEGKWDTVSVIDLENNYFNVKKIVGNYLRNIKEDTPNLIFWTRPCYFLSARMHNINCELKNFSIISSFILQREVQNKDIFINFLNNCLLNTDKDYDETLRKYLNIDFENRRFYGRLEYGVDEYFINYYFLNECYIKKELPFNVVLYKDVSGGFLEWIKNIRFTIPKKEISNIKITQEFIELIVKVFFPDDVKIPDLDIYEKIDWIAEKYYDLSLQILHRKTDQSQELEYFYNQLKDDKFKELDLYSDYIKGLELNMQLTNNSFSNFLITPDGSYPNFKYLKEWTISRS